ncbi:DMT family transporter [Sporolactobacillus kofuensis]|uniref:DMT family transporter n=1 Tax=Sporolactobacillus kofuensis TaxID=269672 RepID=A0ABW1WIF1_9BACL|nr:EamA family transporter [Sporolactobacillus kofuensis]MCO7176395.1 EamA family transporter [Sporolactobacillus kofuensis]
MTVQIHHLVQTRSWKRAFGIGLVLSGATLWGISGNVAQYLFESEQINAGWLTSVRMITAGLLLLVFTLLSKDRQLTWMIWMQKRTASALLIFGVFGMIGAQYTYFEAVAAGNAATATLLQYLSPVLIMIYLVIRRRRRPSVTELLAVFMALLGVFLIVTKGHPDQISIAPAAVFWGLLAALGGALYSTQPGKILKEYGAGVVVSWGMLIGGTVMSLFYSPWHVDHSFSLNEIVGVSFVIVFGTLLAFYLFLASLKYLNPIETSLLGCAEPLSAALVSVVWMHVPFTLFDWVGMVCIIGTVVTLTFAKTAKV